MDPVKLPPARGDEISRPWSRDSHRYLQDSALKFGEDAHREYDRLAISQPSTAPTVTPPKGRVSSMTQREDEQLMRSSFLAEASDCIRSLQAVFESANATTFVSRFDDWRKIDLKATAQMQQHVKTLQNLNELMADFLQRCSAVEVFQDFHATMADLSTSVREMHDFRDHFTSSIDEISKGIADRVFLQLSKEAEERSAWLHCQLEKHGEVQESLAATQRKMWHRLEAMGRTMENQLKATKETTDHLDVLNESHLSVKKDCKSLLDLQQGVFTTFQNSSEQQGALQDNIFATISKEMQSMNGYIFQSLGWNPETPAVVESLQSLESRFVQSESKTLQDMEDQRQEVARMENALRESEKSISKANQLREEGLSEQAALKDHLQKATSALKEMKVQLKDAQMISLLNSMKRLRDIEGRGNVKVDRQSGRVTPVRPIEFLPEAPPKEKGPFKVTFKDEADVLNVVADLLEVMVMFDSSVQLNVALKQGRGGDANSWQRLAERRAETLKEHLVKAGRSEESISICGCMGAASEFFGQLMDTEIFPPKPAPTKASPPSRSKSPAPKRK